VQLAITERDQRLIALQERWDGLRQARVALAAGDYAAAMDAQEAKRRFGARREEVSTPGEIELAGRFSDQAIRDEVANFKRKMSGNLSLNAASEGMSPTSERP
jgi:hypothetical protein